MRAVENPRPASETAAAPPTEAGTESARPDATTEASSPLDRGTKVAVQATLRSRSAGIIRNR